MSLFINELKQNSRVLIYYLIGSTIFIALAMVKGDAFINDPVSSSALLEAFPKSVMALFGLANLDLTTLDGYFACVMFYLIIITLIYAGNLGSDIFLKEERDKTSEFLYTKPISRTKIFFTKTFAAIVLLLIYIVVSIVVFEIVIDFKMKMISIFDLIFKVYSSLFIVGIMFICLGGLLANVLKKSKKAGSYISYLVIFSYVISVMIDLNDKLQFLSYLSFTRYVDVVGLVNTGSMNYNYIYISLIIIVVSMLISLKFFRKRDINI